MAVQKIPLVLSLVALSEISKMSRRSGKSLTALVKMAFSLLKMVCNGRKFGFRLGVLNPKGNVIKEIEIVGL